MIVPCNDTEEILPHLGGPFDGAMIAVPVNNAFARYIVNPDRNLPKGDKTYHVYERDNGQMFYQGIRK